WKVGNSYLVPENLVTVVNEIPQRSTRTRRKSDGFVPKINSKPIRPFPTRLIQSRFGIIGDRQSNPSNSDMRTIISYKKFELQNKIR
ncbi:hypothetical protein HDU67_004332, partial [Dinochytrium kinnereticum]